MLSFDKDGLSGVMLVQGGKGGLKGAKGLYKRWMSERMGGMLGEWLVERFGREVEMKIIHVINKWRTDNFKSNF